MIYRPAHYLKQFHKRYADPAALERLVKETKSRDWAQLFLRKDRLDKFDNPDMPTLQPWMLTTAPPAQRFIAVRNPYFHRVDPRGQQLPYLDRFILEVVDPKLIPIKTGAGETDLQARHLFFKDYTFLKPSEPRSGLRTLLWPEAAARTWPSTPTSTPATRSGAGLFRDQRFREALALGIDRGRAQPVPLFRPGRPVEQLDHPGEPALGGRVRPALRRLRSRDRQPLLDELGLDRRDESGTRLLPDGRPMELVIETAGEDTGAGSTSWS